MAQLPHAMGTLEQTNWGCIMKKYLIGGLVGAVIGATAIQQYSIYQFTRDAEAYGLYDEPSYHSDDIGSSMHNFRVHAAFAPGTMPEYHSTNLRFLKPLPAFELGRNDVQKVCIHAGEEGDLDISLAYYLYPDKKEVFRDALQTESEQRILLESRGDFVTFFYMTPTMLDAYSTQIEANSAEPDMVLSTYISYAPRLLKLASEFTPYRPVGACSESVDLSKIPHWDDMVQDVWEDFNY